MRLAAMLLLFVFCARGAVAQTVPIRSGWQTDFTRLVLTIPEGVAWQLGRSGLDYLLIFEAQGLTFDLAGVFDRIPGTRLGALDASEGELRITAVCDCHIRAFLWRPDRLVLDLVDGPPPEESPYEQPLRPTVEDATVPFAENGLLLGDAIASPAPVIRPDGFEELMPDPFIVPTEEAERLGAAEEALIRSIARAASQGLLTTRPGPPVEEPVVPRPVETVETSAPVVELPSSSSPGIAARTAMDRDLAEADPFAAVDDRADVVCLPQSHFAFDTWGDDQPFHVQISAARRSLVGEFDRLPVDAATDLAKAYLFFGFGSEALGALALIEVPSEDHAILAELARLVDDLPGKTGLFADQLGCRTPAALWSLLGQAAIPARPELDRNGVLQHYKTLPASVQAQVAGRLAPLFLAAGDEDAAEILLNRANRSAATRNEDVKLAEADLAMHYGTPASSLTNMIAAARTDGRTGPEMLLRIFELSVETERAVPSDLLDLSGVLRFEHRGQSVVADLAAAEIRAHLLAGNHDTALTTIEDERSRLAPDRLEALLSETIIAMAEELDDLTFLERILPDPPRPLSPEAENALARRLIAMGMPSPAEQVMQTVPVRDAAGERRYLRAGIALLLEDYPAVDDLLIGITDPRANALRAAALSARGRYGEAFAVDAEAAPDPASAWRAGAWSSLAASPDLELSRFSELVIGRQAPPSGPEAGATDEVVPDDRVPPTIAGGRALLSQSAEARELLDAVLGRFPAPEAER